MKRIRFTDGNIMLYGELNDTLAACDFCKQIPCSATLTDDGDSYRCKVACGMYDPLEGHCIRRKGDILLENNEFIIHYGETEKAEAFLNMTIIGHLEDASLTMLCELPEKVRLYVDFE